MGDEDFKKGMLVAYTANCYGDTSNNPLWGGKYGHQLGEVIHVKSTEGDSTIYEVLWPQGRRNCYRHYALTPVHDLGKLPDDVQITDGMELPSQYKVEDLRTGKNYIQGLFNL